MANPLDYIYSLNPFWQGLVGSALFAILVLVGRLLLRGARLGGKSFYREASRQSVLKHIIYKEFVNSTVPAEFTKGYFFVFSQAGQSAIKALGVLTFFGGVWCALNDSWLMFLGFYFALNFLVDAGSWLKDWGSEDQISLADKNVKEELLNKFRRNTPISVEGEAKVDRLAND